MIIEEVPADHPGQAGDAHASHAAVIRCAAAGGKLGNE
jgi:hypothetical protein